LDIIFIHGLQANCVVGVFEWEKNISQKIILDLDLAFDIKPAAISDKLEDTLNYKAVSEKLIEMLEASRFDLIETMAEEAAKFVLQNFDVKWIRLRLDKGGVVKNVRSVGILIERGEK